MQSSTCCDAMYTVCAPRLGTNDDTVRVLKWLVREGQRVEASTVIVIVETTKASVEVEAETAGYVFPLAEVDAEIAVGAPVAMIADTPERPAVDSTRSASVPPPATSQVVTRSARALIDQHGLTLEPFAALAVVRASDVEQHLAASARAEAPPPSPLVSPEQEAEWEALLESPLHRDVQAMLTALRARMRGRFDRHVPLGTLLGDRWQLAREQNFGDGTSMYDECLIKGQVRVGEHVWIGPYTILDGQHAPLQIGNHVDIGSGAHLYTHDSIERVLTGGKAPLATGPVTIGNCCFIGPMVSMGPGTSIGDHSFVAAGSYVQGSFKPFSFIAGNPARKVGTVQIDGSRARIRRTSTP